MRVYSSHKPFSVGPSRVTHVFSPLLCLLLAFFGFGEADALAAGEPVTSGTNVLAFDREPQPGNTFPSLGGFELEGPVPPDLKGKVVVIDFWASWCAPCKETFPVMEELYARFHKSGLVILGINEDKHRAAMQEFLKDYPVSFPVLRDPKKKLAGALHLNGLPRAFIIGRDGRVFKVFEGFRAAPTRKQYVKDLQRLLAEEPVRTGP